MLHLTATHGMLHLTAKKSGQTHFFYSPRIEMSLKIHK